MDGTFYRRWVLANGWAEAAGLGTTFVIGWSIAPWLSEPMAKSSILAGALAAVLLGTLFEGALVGAAQERVLAPRLPSLRKGSWTMATALGAGLAWLVGMIPSTTMALTEIPDAAPSTEPAPLVQYALAVILGALTGPLLAAVQWTVLRHHVRGAHRWLTANALAWALGMPIVFLGMNHVSWEAPPALVWLQIYAVCGIVGVVVGILHGRVLTRLVDSPA